MKKEMLINVLQPEECRIAIVEDGVLEELYVERASQESYVGNIYKGRIVNIEPSIQAAFVDFGIGRNGFLHVSDVDPAYYKHLLSKADLAEYEAELEREYGSAPGGGRDRGARGGRTRDRGPKPPREMTSWLEPQPAAARNEDLLDEPEFASGLDDIPTAEPVADGADAEAVAEVEEVETETVEADGFADGVVEDAAAEPAVPAPATRAVATPADDDDGFAEGIEPVAPAPKPVAQPPRATVHTPVVKKPAPVEVEEDEFGAGIVDADVPPAPAAKREPEVAPPEVAKAIDALDAGEPAAPVEPPEVPPAPEVAEAPEPEAKKPRARRTKPKVEEPAAEEPAAEAKAKPRTRRKKKEGDGESDGDGSDDKPKYMGGAERRTAASDDEDGEIKPFFDDTGSADFDPDAPNDRFEGERADDGTDPAALHEDRFTEDPEPAEAAEQEARELAHEAEEAAEPEVTGRGFNDDFDSGRSDRGGRGDRDRGGRGGRGDRDRGGRGGRGSRDRDRPGDRGSRDDRGPRTGAPGGFKGGSGPKGGRDRGLPKPPIQEIFKRGQEVIVQVIKEAVGTKGPTLSTYVSIAGRYLVLMPSLNRVGVSRKIEDHDARRRLREIMSTLAPPKGVGFIVRTAAVDRDAKELQNDLAYLLRLWQVVVKRLKRVAGPVEIYRESDMITRTIRDIFTADIDTIWVDEANAFGHASEFLQIVMPKFANRIKHFDHTEPLFHKYSIEEEIAKIHQKRIEMPLGGSLVIEQTEALVAIDVNSGNFRADNNAEETAFQMNLHAAKEIARQLRLRDLGGVIVNDFIDMRSESHRRKVEDAFREALRRDRARTKILRISQFGLIEMTRQRIRPSLKRSIFADCPHCRGNGFVKTSESLAIEVMRLLHLAAHRAPAVQLVQVAVHTDAAGYLLNKKRKEIAALEERGKLEVNITGQPGISPEALSIRCFDHNGNEVRLLPPAPLPKLSAGRVPPRDDRRGGGGRDREDRGSRYPRPLD
ncbi:Rne/Rng family ribonuclease [Gemmata sp. JC717]|uniref:Rne/Rng family ribonuclease n=1 Tax=Gemmata algarum TaxID=2975278 RepID=UPI0021BA7F45|nr:Rne/Rng family ribonuclease [Gemmata algarum]MDY3551710.1 Rne/Rng family ribonuclease [Gemmata algarum]